MELTTNLANGMKISPFEVMAQEIDDVISLLNYYIAKIDQEPTGESKPVKASKNDGFWDF